jgi:hypothetical protein
MGYDHARLSVGGSVMGYALTPTAPLLAMLNWKIELGTSVFAVRP